MPPAKRKRIVKWIRNHHHVIHSPIAKDTVEVFDPITKTRVRKSKLLLQCSVRELLSDLYKPVGVGLGDYVRDENGNPIISDTVFRALLPPELKMMTNKYKQMCMCEICQSFKHNHSSYKRWQSKHLAEQEEELSDMPTHTRAQKMIRLFFLLR